MENVSLYLTIGVLIALFAGLALSVEPLARACSCKHGLWWFACKSCKK